MSVVKERPFSEPQAAALGAIGQYGYIVRGTFGSWLHVPYGAMVSTRTFDSIKRMAQRGTLGNLTSGVVQQNDFQVEALLNHTKTSPIAVVVPQTQEVETVTLSKEDVSTLMVYMVGHCEYREEAGREHGISAREMDVLRRVSKASGIPIPPYEPGGTL